MDVVFIFLIAFSVFAGVSTHQKDLSKEEGLKKEYQVSLKKERANHRPIVRTISKIDGVEVQNLASKK